MTSSNMLQMKHGNWLFLLTALTITSSAPLKNHLVRFFPISRDQYESILGMIAGQPIISEGKLSNSGFRTISDWRTAISNDLSSGWQQLLNITGFLPKNTKFNEHKVNGFPLCVIRLNEWDDINNAEIDPAIQQGREAEESVRNEDNDDNNRQVVNCFVVVKKQEEDEGQQQDQQPPDEYEQHHASQESLRRPDFNAPHPYYPLYPYPVFPFYDYPYYAEVSHSNTKSSQNYARKQTKHKDLARSALSHANSYYPGYGGSYRSYGASNYQQAYPNNAAYGSSGFMETYNPYVNNFNTQLNDESSAEKSDFSSEVDGEIGGQIF